MRLIDAEQAYEIARLHHSDFAMSLADLTSLREVLEDCDTIEVPRWIPVTERLPEKRGMVFVTAYGAVSAAWYCTEDRWELPSGFVVTDGVTHWMPLPSTEGLE